MNEQINILLANIMISIQFSHHCCLLSVAITAACRLQQHKQTNTFCWRSQLPDQTILDFADARDDGRSVWRWQPELLRRQIITINTQFVLKAGFHTARSVDQQTVSKHRVLLALNWFEAIASILSKMGTLCAIANW